MYPNPSELSESLEDYLEAIWCIVREKNSARPKDIVALLGVTSASVTGALRVLAEKELVHYAPYDLVTLTEKGATLASEIYQRHTKMKRFLTDFLHVDEAEAEEVACKMEHTMSDQIINQLVRLAAFLDACPRCGKDWLTHCGQKCEQNASPEDCKECVSQLLEQL